MQSRKQTLVAKVELCLLDGKKKKNAVDDKQDNEMTLSLGSFLILRSFVPSGVLSESILGHQIQADLKERKLCDNKTTKVPACFVVQPLNFTKTSCTKYCVQRHLRILLFDHTFCVRTCLRWYFRKPVDMYTCAFSLCVCCCCCFLGCRCFCLFIFCFTSVAQTLLSIKQSSILTVVLFVCMNVFYSVLNCVSAFRNKLSMCENDATPPPPITRCFAADQNIRCATCTDKNPCMGDSTFFVITCK